ncbi:MAG: type II secretion system GspH family protein [Fusobacterium sp.]|nr:type II secretion system GspH family protein [Fusobacterium sp.]
MKNKLMYTLTGGGGPLLTGFTMVEILLSLTIIGVVAAITLPSLTGNINERTWNTQRKALYSRFSQAMSLMPALNGYGKFKEPTETESAVDTAAETFITDGLAKVMKINNICDSEHLADCGIPDKILDIRGSVAYSSFPKIPKDLNPRYSQVNGSFTLQTKVAAFETQSGESVALFYNPKCSKDTLGFAGRPYFYINECVHMIYDLNGLKGPNQVGKDIGIMSVFYPTDPIVVAPQPIYPKAAWHAVGDKGLRVCTLENKEYRLPNLEELMTVFSNSKLTGVRMDGTAYLSNSVAVTSDGMKVYILTNDTGHYALNSLADLSRIVYICIKR